MLKKHCNFGDFDNLSDFDKNLPTVDIPSPGITTSNPGTESQRKKTLLLCSIVY
jgi:hypothetical protein